MSAPGSLRVVSEPKCGNAPRQEITRRLAVALAIGDEAELGQLLAPTAEWKVLGETARCGLAAIVEWSVRSSAPSELRVLSIITHGREASIDGEIVTADGHVTGFCHVVRFASTARAAPVTVVRTYRAASVA
jgi:hypothetical protein